MAEFSFRLTNPKNLYEVIIVTIHRAEIVAPPDKFTYNDKFKPREKIHTLLNNLTPERLSSKKPGSTIFLIRPHLRIDSQEVSDGLAKTIWRNIHIQNGIKDDQWTYSVVKIEQGASLCYVVNHERKLLHYLHQGLLESEPKRLKYIIRVTFQKDKKKYENNRKIKVSAWKPNKEEIESLEKNLEKRFKDNKKMRENRIKYPSNKIRAATETDMINEVVSAIKRNVAKKEEHQKELIVSTFFGIFIAVHRTKDGDIVKEVEKARIAGAVAKVASGILFESRKGKDFFLYILNS